MDLSASDLNMTNEEFGRFIRKYILEVLADNKNKRLLASDFKKYEPLKWVNIRTIVAHLYYLEKRYQVEVIRERTGYTSGYIYYKYISPQRTARLLARNEYEETTERYRYEVFIEQHRKWG